MNLIRPTHTKTAPTSQLYDHLHEVAATNGETELTLGLESAHSNNLGVEKNSIHIDNNNAAFTEGVHYHTQLHSQIRKRSQMLQMLPWMPWI